MRHLREKDGIEEDTAPLLQELKNALKKAQSESIHTKETLIPEQTPKVTISPPGEVKQTPKITVSPPGQAKQTPPGVTASPPKKAKQIYGKKEPAPEEAGPEPMDTARTPGIDTTVIDRVTDLACEMVMIRNRLLNLSEYFKQKYSDDCEGEALLETVSFLDRVTSDLQLAVMKMRMQPITPAVIQT
ncbi:MAG: hypothetical protein GTN43_00785, partial [Candidatus Aenigmarchaeota archaeon]|nr:hypothetical protein [Candidatus Aenigmarchaeota archaeon]